MHDPVPAPGPSPLILSLIEHPFHRSGRTVRRLDWTPAVTLASLIGRFVPRGMRVRVYLNGEHVPAEHLHETFPMPGDAIAVAPELGDEDKGILRAILMIATAAISMWAAPWLMGFSMFWGNALLTSMLAGSLMLIGGLVVNSLLPPASPSLDTPDNALGSRAYSWSPHNTEQQGIPIAAWFGRNRVYGNIVNSFIDTASNKQYLNLVICLGMGPIHSISNIEINGQPLRSFKEVQREVRFGYVNQPPLDLVKATKVEYHESVKIEDEASYIYTTVGDDFDRLEVDVTFPNGIWYADPQKKALQPHIVQYRIALRLSGTDTWISIGAVPEDGYGRFLVTTGRWSAGKLVDVSTSPQWEGKYTDEDSIEWAEWTTGSIDPEDTNYSEGKKYVPPPGSDHPGDLVWQWTDSGTHVATPIGSVANTFKAKSNKTKPRRYTHTYKVPDGARGRYEVRITKVDPAPEHPDRYGRDMYFAGVAEVHMDRFKYSRQALLALRVLADDQLSGSIRVSCEMKGLVVRKWNGDCWVFGYSTNPAWIACHILTQPVITGTGTPEDPFEAARFDGLDPDRIDHVKFAQWADYCDELVPDGKGGQEKRITFNGGCDYDGNMWEAAMRVFQVGRAMPVWFGRMLTVAVDRPSEPVNLYSVGNIEESRFKETFLPLEDRATEIEVDYVNRDTWERDKLTVYQAGANNGYRASIELFGITKASEAWRAGMYRLMCNKYLIRTVEIDVDIEAINASIGDVVYIQHDVPQWGNGGRIVSATSNTVTLDREVTIEAGLTYKLLVRRGTDAVVERTIANEPGIYTTLTVASPYVANPQPFDVYAFGQVNRITRPFRILEIKRAMDQKCTLACIEYRPEIYQYETSIPGFDSKGQQALMAMQPKAVVLTQYRAAGVDGRQQQCIGISFEPSADPACRYVEVWYQKARGTKSKSDWLYAGRTSGDSFEIVGIDKYWTYEVKLLPVRSNGQKLYLGYAESYFITIEGITRAADLLYSTGENVDDLQPAEPLATAGAVVGDGLDVDGNLVRSDGSTLVTEDDLMLNNVLVRRIRIDSEGSFVTGLSPDPRIEITQAEIAGYSDAGTRQFYISALDGRAYAGAGAVVLSSDGVSVRCGSAWALRNTLAFVREDDPARRLFSMWAVNGTSAVEGVIELNDFYLGASADKPFSLAMKTFSPLGRAAYTSLVASSQRTGGGFASASLVIVAPASGDPWAALDVQLRSSVSTGTAPFTLSSSTLCENLNADLIDGKHASDFFPASGGSLLGTTVSRDSDSSALYLQGASGLATGAHLMLFGQDHATYPGRINLSFGGLDDTGVLVIRHRNSTSYVELVKIDPKGNLLLGAASSPADATRSLVLRSGTAPTAGATDCCVLYSADISAGNAALHARTEAGHIIRLYQQPSISDPSGGSTIDTQARAALSSILSVLRNTGLIAS